MQILQNLNMSTLSAMLERHSEYYAKMLTDGATSRQYDAGKRVIAIIQEEINLRNAMMHLERMRGTVDNY